MDLARETLQNFELNQDEIAEKMFHLAVKPLRFIWLHPTESSMRYQIVSCTFYTLICLSLYYFAIKYAFVYEMDIVDVSQLISSFGLITLGLLKVLPLVYYNEVVKNLLQSKKNYWSADIDPILRTQVINIYASAYRVGRFFIILVLMTLSLYLTRPIYDKGSAYILQWFNKDYYGWVILHQTIFAIMLVALVLGFNGLFSLSVTNVRTQFRILNWTIQHRINDGSENDFKILIKFIKQHRFLMGNVRDIEKVFMIQLLALYMLTIASSCMELYSLAETPLSFSAKCRTFVYLISLFVQLAMFCFPAAELTNEIFLLSESLYLWNWQDGSRQLQTWLPFVLSRTQQVVDFKALGLVTINKMAFVNVFKSTISFLTLMRDMN